MLMLIAVTAIFLIFMFIGFRRGLFRAILKLAMTGFSFLLAYFLAPLVCTLIIQNTGVDDYFHDKIYAAVKSQVEEQATEYVNSVMAEADTTLFEQTVSQLTESIMATEPDRNTQISLIQGSGLPSYIQNALIANNNDETKTELGVSGFYDYIATYVSYMLVNAASFILTVIIIRALFGILSICVSYAVELPIIGSINRIGGMLFGAIVGLLVVWLFLLIVSLFEDTELGQTMYSQIYSNGFLTLLYEKNIFIKIIEELGAIIK